MVKVGASPPPYGKASELMPLSSSGASDPPSADDPAPAAALGGERNKLRSNWSDFGVISELDSARVSTVPCLVLR